MRWIVLLLLLLNVAVFGYFKLQSAQPAGPVAGHEAIQPEKLRILTPEEVDAMPAKAQPSAPAPVPPPEPVACYEWGSFPNDSLQIARAAIERLAVDSVLQQTASQEARRYWVYIPPRKTPEEAQAKVDEVKALGVEEIFVVQEPKWKNAISLGVFKDEALANRLLDDLKAKGVKSAIKGVRNHESGQSHFLLKNVNAHTADELSRLRPEFPGSEIRKVTCP